MPQPASISSSAGAVRTTYRRCEIGSVTEFPTLRRESTAENQCQIVETYWPEIMSRQRVFKWVRSFKGHTDPRSERLWHLCFRTIRGFVGRLYGQKDRCQF
ncbi:hypothetical protein AAG570_004283 [Ranatra chinensis]|uniref:Uncharacterized protein n=1 Tax=Ranatra chinensis TaxID=642074 RepID=A0ABD0Y1Y3_9HEMI